MQFLALAGCDSGACPAAFSACNSRGKLRPSPAQAAMRSDCLRVIGRRKLDVGNRFSMGKFFKETVEENLHERGLPGKDASLSVPAAAARSNPPFAGRAPGVLPLIAGGAHPDLTDAGFVP